MAKLKTIKASFTTKWSAIIEYKEPITAAKLTPGNFYKINTYKYVDGTTKRLSGIITTYIFLIGKYTSARETKLAAIKLGSLSPEFFFADLKLALRFIPMPATQIDRVVEETENELTTFQHLLKKFPMDGKPLFTILKNKKRTYEGNYREYKLKSILSAEYIEFSPIYLKSVLTKNAKKNEEKLMRDDMTNERDAVVKDRIVADKPQKG